MITHQSFSLHLLFYVSENTQINTVLFRADAKEIDSSITTKMVFKIDSVIPIANFRVDSNTAFVYLDGVLDYETAQSHELTLSAGYNDSVLFTKQKVYNTSNKQQ